LLVSGDIAAIARWLNTSFPGKLDGRRYVLQQFRGIQTLDPILESYTPYTSNHLKEMAAAARGWLADVKVRGV
jgi:hypothetical protein